MTTPTPLPIGPDTVLVLRIPPDANIKDAMACARLIHESTGRLVIVLPNTFEVEAVDRPVLIEQLRQVIEELEKP